MMKPLLTFLTTGCLFVLFVSYAPASVSHKTAPPNGPLDPSKIDISKTRISIDKSDYRLHLYEGDSLLKSYPVVFGFNPTDDKMQEGDGCTPEGTFKVRTKYAHKSWSRFIWVDYPNEDSWRKFNKRKKEGIIPMSATIGGEIGIHGVFEGYDEMIAKRDNWTLGCISLTNEDIVELYALVQDGSEIEIHK